MPELSLGSTIEQANEHGMKGQGWRADLMI